MATLEELTEQHNRQIDSQVNAFERSLGQSLSRAEHQIIAELSGKLTIADGVIQETAANQAILRTAGRVIDVELARAGYDRVINGFVNEFPGQLPWFQHILDQLGAGMGERLAVKFTAQDRKFFAQRQASTVEMLNDEVARGIAAAKRQALFSVAGMPLRELVTEITGRLDVSVSQASALADTALPGFYRTIAARGYDQIEAGLKPGVEARYSYIGPLDKLNRPCCHKWAAESRRGKTWSTAEIALLDNGKGQPRPVRIYCGGWRCRHQFGIRSLT